MIETKKSVLKPSHTKYLNELRESGKTNMFGASQYLIWEFGVDRKEAKAILLEWFSRFK